jgi:hypothetical protein
MKLGRTKLAHPFAGCCPGNFCLLRYMTMDIKRGGGRLRGGGACCCHQHSVQAPLYTCASDAAWCDVTTVVQQCKVPQEGLSTAVTQYSSRALCYCCA